MTFVAISKHLMLLFNTHNKGKRKPCIISKHLMLLFNVICNMYNHIGRRISKHLMLLFSHDCAYLVYCRSIISKHLMLLFSFFVESIHIHSHKFQNISCYCLARMYIVIIRFWSSFQNISCYCLAKRNII